MNRITNKEYLIDITIKTLETQQLSHPTKVKCEVHYSDDSYLRIQLQPLLRNGVALFCDQRLRIPFSSEVSIVFKLIKPNKKQLFLGHYLLQVEKLLSNKEYHVKVRDKLEQSEAIADFECKIIDKQLLCQSDNQEPELDITPLMEKSIVTWAEHIHKAKVDHTFSQLNTPIFFRRSFNSVPMPPEEYGKIVRQAEDILKKRQLFSQRHEIMRSYSRDKYGMLRTTKLKQLQERLGECRKDKMNSHLIVYVIIGLISFFIGMQL